ncbi:MAG: aminotransferase class V-fold PLP-dependent enzyme [Rhodobacteraceae bacterium]|jgi:selenocysteine lyase/cysteine desulfurase|nr:aminotransferase class V-fold PLP-dependent enzyme [Paracoccaceae bacterium]
MQDQAKLSPSGQGLLRRFQMAITGPDAVARLRRGLIGENAVIDGPFGPKPLIYADHVASGRALAQVEDVVRDQILPFYSNSHTEASACGAFMTRLREEARAVIAGLTGAGPDCSVIFAGSGATAGLNRLVNLLGLSAAVARGEVPLVLIGPYEHHSNILPWRESGAEVIMLDEAPGGGPDLDQLAMLLAENAGSRLTVGAFSAASNVSGILTDTVAVSALLRRHGALSVWDYAGGGPYLPIDMVDKDAVVLSPHKFPGGPGASGLLILRNSAVTTQVPTWPGGGTVAFVSPWAHDYSRNLVRREEAGTPNTLGDIRAAMTFLVKAAIGQSYIDRRHRELLARARAVWQRNPRIRILGLPDAPRLPIFSFQIQDDCGYVDPQQFTRLLSDRYGIQARGGCACAGPYGHRLLGIDEAASEHLRRRIAAGEDQARPGWVRLNLSYLMDDAKADTIIRAVDELARGPGRDAVTTAVPRFGGEGIAHPAAGRAIS